MAASPKSRTGTKPDLKKSVAPVTTIVTVEVKEPLLACSEAAVGISASEEASAPVPGDLLIRQQFEALANLNKAMDGNCMILLAELSAAREAHANSADMLSTATQEFAEYRSNSERELASAQRTQAILQQDLASVREALGRAHRSAAVQRHSWDPRSREGEAQAERLIPLLNAVLAAGEIKTVHDTPGALAQFGAAGMVDSLEGSQEAPICNGWLLSRADIETDPLIFLLDDTGLLGWTEGNRERLDVNMAFQNTKPRPGFKTVLSRTPVGRVRAIVAVSNREAPVVFFESSSHVVTRDVFLAAP